MKIFKIIPGNYALVCYYNVGPCFYNQSLIVPNDFFKNNGIVGATGDPFKFKKDFEINNGKKNFKIKELEIFQVLY